MSSDTVLTVRVGGEDIPTALCANGQSFIFRPEQIQFIVQMQRLKNVCAAALSVGKDESWGDTFLRCKKFRAYLAAKMQEMADKNSLNVEWWYQFGKWSAEGRRKYWQGRCGSDGGCGLSCRFSEYDVEQHRKDDMTLEVPCPACYRTMAVDEKVEEFKPNREQLVAWQELGSRLIPKIERVHHAYENVQIQFETDGEVANG